MKKLSRSVLVLLIGFSLSSPAAFACEIPDNGFFAWVYQFIHHEPDVNRDRGDQHHSSGGRNCSGGGHSSGSTGGSGTTTPPTSPKS